MYQTTSTQESISSVFEQIKVPASTSSNRNHPFASGSEDTHLFLQQIAHAAEQVSNSLNTYLTLPWTQPKLVSMLRQQSILTSSLRTSENKTKQFVDALQERAGIVYSEDIPLDSASVAKFCIFRLEAWSMQAGMETFQEGGDDNITVMLGGKVLVVDVHFSLNKEDPLRPRARVASVKTSYATSDDSSGASSNTKGSISLDVFLAESIQKYCDEVQRPEHERDPVFAARLGQGVQQQLRYLIMLDRLAQKKAGARVAWFVDTDELCPKVEAFAKSEAETIASNLAISIAPLDIFLMRAHTLPLPYLSSPSITFLVYLSPLAYLKCIQGVPSPTARPPNLPSLNIPLGHLRSVLPEISRGVTTATLSVTPLTSPPLFTPMEQLPGIASRPIFSFCAHGAEIRHIFPQNDPTPEADYTATHHVWTLDFTDGGKRRGVVMSQSRMRDIELLITPLGGLHSDLDDINIISFSANTWVDILLNPGSSIKHEKYTALYTSPGGLHPPLELKLTPPDEPGFVLERIPVHNIQEVWGILEIVREQCWLNETILACDWHPGSMRPEVNLGMENLEITNEELQAVLAGTMVPEKIPINISVDPPNNEDDNLFGPSTTQHRPMIVIRSPERPPITGLVEITVSLDETRPRGITVEVKGAMVLDMRTDVLEEICRRGGTFGLPGRIWMGSGHTI